MINAMDLLSMVPTEKAETFAVARDENPMSKDEFGSILQTECSKVEKNQDKQDNHEEVQKSPDVEVQRDEDNDAFGEDSDPGENLLSLQYGWINIPLYIESNQEIESPVKIDTPSLGVINEEAKEDSVAYEGIEDITDRPEKPYVDTFLENEAFQYEDEGLLGDENPTLDIKSPDMGPINPQPFPEDGEDLPAQISLDENIHFAVKPGAENELKNELKREVAPKDEGNSLYKEGEDGISQVYSSEETINPIINPNNLKEMDLDGDKETLKQLHQEDHSPKAADKLDNDKKVFSREQEEINESMSVPVGDKKLDFSQIIKTQNVGDKVQLIEELSQRVVATIDNKKTQLEIQVKPEYLGKLLVKVAMEDGNLVGKIYTDNPEVKDFLQSNLKDLKSSLENQGFVFASLDVDVGGDQHNSQFPQGTNRHKARIKRVDIRSMVENIQPSGILDTAQIDCLA